MRTFPEKIEEIFRKTTTGDVQNEEKSPMVKMRNVADLRRAKVRSVIIGDDDRVTRSISILRAMLTKEGYAVLGEAKTGLQTAVLFDQYHPNVVLLDINMPKGTGLTTLRLIREIDPNARVIMLTGDTSSELVKDALRLGARDFVSKISGNERILEALKKVLT